MAKKGDPCYRCGGGRILTAFKHVEGGKCFRCNATGIDPGPDTSPRDYRPRERLKVRQPRPSPQDAKWFADEAFRIVAGRFQLAEDDGNRIEAGFDSLEELYMNIGHHLAMAVFDHRFSRAIERARARVPARYRKGFEANLAQGIRQWAQDYEGVVWDGR